MTLKTLFRNAPTFYKGVALVQPCLCHLHPELPRLPSPDGRAHIFAPQETWLWPADLEFLRLLPSHTVLEPSSHVLQRACRQALQHIVKRLSMHVADDFMDVQVETMASALFSQTRAAKLDFTPIRMETIERAKSIVQGLVVDVFQKTKHTLALSYRLFASLVPMARMPTSFTQRVSQTKAQFSILYPRCQACVLRCSQRV